jgi:hypothetical protein
VTLHGVAAKDSWTLEAHVVDRVGIRDVQVAAGRIYDHIEQRGADMREAGGLRQIVGVDSKYIRIRQAEAYRIVPVAPEFVFPVTLRIVVFDNHADLRRRLA